MSTGTSIIEEALEEIGVHSVLSPSSPENIIKGMKKLNSMLEGWLSKNILIGFTPLEAPGDNLNEPADTRNGIIYNLAINLASTFKVAVSPDLKGLATVGMDDIAQIYQVHVIPAKVVSDTLPVGAGNRRWRDARVFFPVGTELDSPGLNE